jgi:hypothetical protein
MIHTNEKKNLHMISIFGLKKNSIINQTSDFAFLFLLCINRIFFMQHILKKSIKLLLLCTFYCIKKDFKNANIFIYIRYVQTKKKTAASTWFQFFFSFWINYSLILCYSYMISAFQKFQKTYYTENAHLL